MKKETSVIGGNVVIGDKHNRHGKFWAKVMRDSIWAIHTAVVLTFFCGDDSLNATLSLKWVLFGVAWGVESMDRKNIGSVLGASENEWAKQIQPFCSPFGDGETGHEW